MWAVKFQIVFCEMRWVWWFNYTKTVRTVVCPTVWIVVGVKLWVAQHPADGRLAVVVLRECRFPTPHITLSDGGLKCGYEGPTNSAERLVTMRSALARYAT